MDMGDWDRDGVADIKTMDDLVARWGAAEVPHADWLKVKRFLHGMSEMDGRTISRPSTGLRCVMHGRWSTLDDTGIPNDDYGWSIPEGIRVYRLARHVEVADDAV